MEREIGMEREKEKRKLWKKLLSTVGIQILPIILLILLGGTYPLMRELLFVYFIAEALEFLLQFAGICQFKKPMLAKARVLLWAVLLLFFISPMGYFQANILIAITMALLAFACIWDIASIKKRIWKDWSRKGKIIAISAILGFALYLLLGILISGFYQPKISEEFLQKLDANQFYGEGESVDRAVIIEDNYEALLERVRMIHNAKERVILSTFDFRDDQSGRVMIAAMLNAASRGVKVQVVVDGVSGMLRMGQNPYFFALSSHPNAEIRIYNKINPFKPWALMGRLHDKYLIVDDSAYILGGRNTFSYFLGNSEGHINYDRDALVYNTAEGESSDSSIYQVEAYFQAIWESGATGKYHNSEWIASRRSVKMAREDLGNIYEDYLAANPSVFEPMDYRAMTYPTKRITLLSNPTVVTAKEPEVFYALAALMENASENVAIHTPYIMCNQMMYDALRRIAEAVPEARLMTNSAANNGNPFGSGDYLKHVDQILETGLWLYEYEGGVSYHAKSIVIDDDISIVGSFNMDMRSVYLDTELMLVIDSQEVNAQLREIMARYEAESGHVLADGSKEYPEGVVPQEMSAKKKIRVKLLYGLLSWARRLL